LVVQILRLKAWGWNWADDVPKEEPTRNRELLICDLPPKAALRRALLVVPPKD
jgi:hypothetical protein